MRRKIKRAWISEDAHRAFKQKAAVSGKSFIDVVDDAVSKESQKEKKKLENWKLF